MQKQQHYFFSMASNSLWQDDYWVLLMQLYQQKPVGIKPMYSRRMVELCMELHLAPQFMYEKMFELISMMVWRLQTPLRLTFVQ